MARLWFRNSQGQERVIANCETFADVMSEIDKFITDANDRWPNKKPFKRHYTRIWEEDGMTMLDVGSWSEFFYIEKNFWDKISKNPDNINT